MVRPIGAGVVGEVHEALEKATGRRVALKRLFPDVSHNTQFSLLLFSFLDRLRTTKQVATLARIIDLYHDEEDILCIVSEYLDGISLETHVKTHGLLPEYHALDLIYRIALSLNQSYSEILPFHGLLNPNNILLINPTDKDERCPIKFLDYGTARAASEYQKTRQTTGKRKAMAAPFSVGDPQYLAPEQCSESGEVDAQADVYAIGLLLSYMLSGHPPFAGSAPVKVMSLQMEADPVSLQVINNQASSFSKELIRDTLRKEPRERPTLAQLLARIEEYKIFQKTVYNGYNLAEFIRAERYLAVYSARHQESQQVAIVKIVDPERTRSQFRTLTSRFLGALQTRAERQLVGFVPSYGFGQLPSQQTYAIFEPTPGTLLADVIAARQSMDSQVWQDRALLIGRRLAEILSQVHAQRVLYLGLRPQNVLLTEDAAAPDGLIIRLCETETVRPFQQTEATILGSDLPEELSVDLASYMSLEQLLGAADASADVYALGAILYEMLSGHRPLVATTVDELKSMHINAAPPGLHQLNSAISPELARLVHAMLDELSARRPSMSQVARELPQFAESVETQRFSRLSLDEFEHLRGSRSPEIEPAGSRPLPTVSQTTPFDVSRQEVKGTPSGAQPLPAISDELTSKVPRQSNPPREPRKRSRPSFPPPGGSEVPRQFGSYEVVRCLGEGGMGAVYEAMNPETGERVAIKQPRPELMVFPMFAERFRNEVRFAKRINHPGVVQVLDFDQSEPDRPYIVMELIQGETLKSRLDKGRLPLAKFVEIALQIADTLRAAHEAGVVHRDLKPDNVMLVPDPSDSGRELVKILDFGIAKMVVEYQATILRGPHKTVAGAVLGTPQYMAPEQRQDSSSVTDRADVYSLGVILYEMLCSKAPLTVDEAAAMLHTKKYIPPPPLQDQATGIPNRLVALVHSMLLEEPSRRPSTTAVCAALVRLNMPPGSSTIHDGFQQILLQGRRRHAALAMLVGIVIIGVVLGLRWRRGHNIDQRLQTAERAIKERRWNEATAEAQALLSKETLSQSQQALARAYLNITTREQQAAEKYALFGSTTDPEEAHKLYLGVPANSVYRPPMEEKHHEVVNQLVQKYVAAARTAQVAGLCDEWKQRIAQAAELLPDDARVKAAQAKACSQATAGPSSSQNPRTAPSALKPGEQTLRNAENAYGQGRHREAIRLARQALLELDKWSASRAWRLIGAASCQLDDDDGIQVAGEMLASTRADFDFHRMEAACKRKDYHWNGSRFIFVRSRTPGKPPH